MSETTAERTTLERATRLIRAATGEDYGDGYIVTDVIVGYAEPGYGSDDAVIVLGNWNPPRFPGISGGDPLTREESRAPRLAKALERVGAETQWLDEWTRCGDCHRAMRITADSYSWMMHGAYVEAACDYICADCLRADMETAVEDYVDNAETCITWCDGSDLESIGFVRWEPRDPHAYESGWHPGQTDDPKAITAEIRREMGDDAEILFLLDESSQFYIRFSAYVRGAEIDDDND